MYAFPLVQKAISLAAILFLLTIPVGSFSQASDTTENSLVIKAQLRPRFEVRDGAFRPLNKGEKPAMLMSQRTRFTIDYAYRKLLSIRVSPQSVNIWGQANTTQAAENSGNQFAIFEAWAKLTIAPHWSLTMGRQVISLDDERFFGELDWAQGGRAHDALLLQYNKDKLMLKGYLAYNQNYKALYANNINNPAGNLYNTTDALPYKLMQTIWVGFPIDRHATFSFVATNIGLQQANASTDAAKTFYSQTFGANYFLNSPYVSGNVSAYWQTGKNSTGTQTRAFLIAGFANVPLTKKWNVGMGADWVSGNSSSLSSNSNSAFTPYFHTGHKFYGAMDFYYVGNAHKNAGLLDGYVKLQYKTEKGNAVSVALHQFNTPNKINDGIKKLAKNLGQEVDIAGVYTVNKYAVLTGGYSFYLTTPTIHYLKGTTNAKGYQQWLWLSININPTIFKNNY